MLLWRFGRPGRFWIWRRTRSLIGWPRPTRLRRRHRTPPAFCDMWAAGAAARTTAVHTAGVTVRWVWALHPVVGDEVVAADTAEAGRRAVESTADASAAGTRAAVDRGEEAGAMKGRCRRRSVEGGRVAVIEGAAAAAAVAAASGDGHRNLMSRLAGIRSSLTAGRKALKRGLTAAVETGGLTLVRATMALGRPAVAGAQTETSERAMRHHRDSFRRRRVRCRAGQPRDQRRRRRPRSTPPTTWLICPRPATPQTTWSTWRSPGARMPLTTWDTFRCPTFRTAAVSTAAAPAGRRGTACTTRKWGALDQDTCTPVRTPPTL